MARTAAGLTLMAVHAHPDDEASSTGGILAHYADEGVQVVLVTCTGGELGDGPGGVKPGEAGHDEQQVVAARRAELEASCSILGVSSLEMLGYHDSGMAGWPQNDAPGSFWTTPLEEASARLAALVERYRPQVVVTYDDNGFYGHPDHIMAHRVTVAALAETEVAAKLYCPAIPRSSIARFASLFSSDTADVPSPEELEGLATDDELVTTHVDCSAVVGRKRAALAAHASQMDNAFFLRVDTERFAEVFGRESFVRLFDTTGAPVPEDDLFAGVR